MLIFLAATTQPDILFAVHQCAKFFSDPKRSYDEAVKRIGRYLRQTRLLGIIFKPDDTFRLDCFDDADFAGAFKGQLLHTFSLVLSRSGYIIFL